MEDFKSRLIEERNELETKTNKLESFIALSSKFKELDKENQSLLRLQHNTMKEYLSILEKRISILI